jgi:hypothetical protein
VKSFVKRNVVVLIFALVSTWITQIYAFAADVRVIDIARITWSGAAEPAVSTTDIVNSINNTVRPNWSNFTTLQGDTRDRSVSFTHGQTLSTPVRLVAPMACERNDFTSFMNTVRDEVYRQLGLTDWKERYLIILSPANGCIWSGRASVGNFATKGGVMVLHNNASGFVITHELGHSLGLGHSNLLRCDNGQKDGAWSRSCKAVEYGGSIDVMGNVETTSPLSTYHQWRMGLLEKYEIKQSWLNENIELNASDLYGGTRAVFIRDGKSTYWIEYRRPRTGSSYNPGLVIYRTDPPSPSFIDSPNPTDNFGYEPGLGVATDMWMLNLDNYAYSAAGRASGSMTLAATKSTTFYSGNVSIEAVAASTDQKIIVKIARKPDTVAPPVPPVTPVSTWRYPGAEIIESGYDDADSAIAGFEAQVDGNVVAIESTLDSNFVPTYLDPLVTRRAVYVKDLPEGSYSLSIRATDVWGNKSAWSPVTKVTIDRGLPVVKSATNIVSATSENMKVALTELSDAGSGLCSTQIVNQDGFVLQSSSKKSAPEFTFKRSTDLSSTIQVFDCLGNGIIGDLKVKSSFIAANSSSRTGKWIASSLGEGALTCTAKCSASFTSSGKAHILVAEGEANILVSGKSAAKVAFSSAKTLRTGAIVDLGNQRKVLRVSGSKFTLIGIAGLNLEITNQKEKARIPAVSDPSLSDAVQVRMSQFGFNADDFAHEWIVLPMARGTTLEDPTLDLCSATYKSESGRQYRRQLTVSKVATPYLFLSSEVVKYKDKTAADSALVELKSNFEACVKNKGGVERDGTFVDYTFSAFPKLDATLVPESNRVFVRAQIGKGVSARHLLAFYQFKNEMFTGLYVVTAGETPVTDAEVKRWSEAAALLAQRLNTNF